MSQPVRLRLSRAAGFDLQAHSRAINGLPAVSVTRGPGRRWGNPFVIRYPEEAARAVAAHAMWLQGVFPDRADLGPPPTIAKIREDLAGRNLACWCHLDAPCHADTLLRFAASPA